MKAISKVLAGGVAIAAAAVVATPASAQYYPGYGYGGGGDIVGAIINSVVGGGYGYNQHGYGVNSQQVVNQCANAVQARLSGGYGAYGSPYGGYGNAYAGGRVLGISRVEQRRGGLNVRGVANSGRYATYGYNQAQEVDLVWNCRTDYRGMIVDIDINPAQRTYGAYNQGYMPNQSYTPWNNDYSQYGYRRY